MKIGESNNIISFYKLFCCLTLIYFTNKCQNVYSGLKAWAHQRSVHKTLVWICGECNVTWKEAKYQGLALRYFGDNGVMKFIFFIVVYSTPLFVLILFYF